MDGWVAAVQVVPKAFDHPSSASTAAIYACVRAGLKEAQRLMSDVNATCPMTFADAGESFGEANKMCCLL